MFITDSDLSKMQKTSKDQNNTDVQDTEKSLLERLISLLPRAS